MKITTKTINYAVDTIEQLLLTDGVDNDTIIVTDENRGGVFVFRDENSQINNGGTIFNGWTRQYDGAVNVKWFGASPLSSAVTNKNIFETVCNYFVDVFIPSGIYMVSSPIHITSRVNITGEGNSTILKADSSFIGKVFTDVGKSTITTLYGLIINIEGNFNDVGGARNENSNFKNFNIDGNSISDGIIFERFNDTIVSNCNIYNSKNYGVYSSTYTWGVRINNLRIESFTTAGIFLGEANNGVDISGVVIWGFPTRGLYGIQSSGNNNGVNISGGVIERVENGIYLTSRFGPFNISGIDFEDTTYYNIKAVCPDYNEARLAGPISISGCYFDSNAENIYNSIAEVSVSNSRFRASPHFIADTTYGVNISKDNIFDGASPVVSSGRFHSKTNTTTGVKEKLYSFNSSTSYRGETKDYYLSNHQPSARNGYINVTASSQGGGADLHTGQITIAAISTAYTVDEYSTTAITINNIGSNRSLSPGLDNDVALGQPGTRYSVLYSGTGTINTSDAREKTFSDIPEVETQVAKELKSLVRRFKFNDAIESKGIDKARIHYGASAQEVIAVFEKYGLDAMEYAMVCYDEWEETPEVKDEEGNVTQAYVPAGNRYGIRYEELIMFILGAI